MSRVGGAFRSLIGLANGAGTLGIIMLMVFICGDVLMRAAFSQPIAGIPELVRVSIVGIVFLQAAHTLAVGRFTSSEILLEAVARRSPKAARALKCFYSLLGTGFFAVLAFGTFEQFRRALRTGDYLGVEGIFTIPTWPVRAVVVLGCVLLAIQFLINAYRHLNSDDIFSEPEPAEERL